MSDPEQPQNHPININFISTKEEFSEAVYEYQNIWREDGVKIITTFERITDLPFEEESIEVEVIDGPSSSGTLSSDNKMKLRFSYDLEYKKAALIHELLHRHLDQHHIPTLEKDSHFVLNLVLYDIWSELYGTEFANKAVEIEKNRKNPLSPYKEAWEWALDHNKEDRQKLFAQIRDQLKASPDNTPTQPLIN